MTRFLVVSYALLLPATATAGADLQFGADGSPALLQLGAVALAAHGYVRFTEDLDLGVNTDLGALHKAAEVIRTAGFEVELREPDGQDPLGGVVDVRGPYGLVQIVNYGG